jgi:hypothetical protein
VQNVWNDPRMMHGSTNITSYWFRRQAITTGDNLLIVKDGKYIYIYIYIYIYFIHLAVYLMTGPKPLPKRALHIMRFRASSFKWEYPLLFLRSSSSFLRLLPRLPVTSILPCIFHSVTRCRMQFLRKMWPNKFVFRLRISCRVYILILLH